MAYRLDTAAAAERIVAAGADPALARAVVAEVARADESIGAKVCLRAELATFEVRLRKWVVGIALATAALLFAALRLTGGAL